MCGPSSFLFRFSLWPSFVFGFFCWSLSFGLFVFLGSVHFSNIILMEKGFKIELSATIHEFLYFSFLLDFLPVNLGNGKR